MTDNVKQSLTKNRKSKPLESGYYWVVKKGSLAWQVAFWNSYLGTFQFCGDVRYHTIDAVAEVIPKPLTGGRRKVKSSFTDPP